MSSSLQPLAVAHCSGYGVATELAEREREAARAATEAPAHQQQNAQHRIDPATQSEDIPGPAAAPPRAAPLSPAAGPSAERNQHVTFAINVLARLDPVRCGQQTVCCLQSNAGRENTEGSATTTGSIRARGGAGHC